ncbi:hypothetical protein [Bacillus nakamurai]|nr:hypothetical protein [Bacillus nakamurai]
MGEVNVNRKEGWRIYEKDLEDFIERMKPGLKKLFFLMKNCRMNYRI